MKKGPKSQPAKRNSPSELVELGVDVELTLTASSLSSLDVLLTSTTTSFLGSTRTKFRHWKVRCPAIMWNHDFQ